MHLRILSFSRKSILQTQIYVEISGNAFVDSVLADGKQFRVKCSLEWNAANCDLGLHRLMCVKVATMGDKSDPGKASDTEVSIAKTDFQTQRPVLGQDVSSPPARYEVINLRHITLQHLDKS